MDTSKNYKGTLGGSNEGNKKNSLGQYNFWQHTSLKPNSNLLSEPNRTYLFYVEFVVDDKNGAKGYASQLIPLNTALPKAETKIITQHFFGTHKSFPISTDFSGDTEMSFYMRSDEDQNPIYRFLSLQGNPLTTDYQYKTEDTYVRMEMIQPFNKIKIHLIDSANYIRKIYTLCNPIITNLSHTDVDYGSEEFIKVSLTVHYDDWFYEEFKNYDSDK